MTDPSPVDQYLELGLRLGRHLDGLVDAYYGPPELAEAAANESPRPLPALAADARRLIADLDGGADPSIEAPRRAFLRAQSVGLETTARKLAGDPMSYVEEVEACYGITPQRVSEDALAEAHRRLEAVVPGTGPLAERMIAWRESQLVPPEKLQPALASLAEDFRDRTRQLFGLPEGEHVEWMLETDKPWSGFNYYEGNLRSRVAINVDLPVPSPSLGHLVAHEAYPGHHTEHTRKEVGLVRRRRQLEETIFCVGTPQCLMAEGLADLGLEVLLGSRPEPALAEHLRPLGIPYDAEVVAEVSVAAEALAAVRGNVALAIHADGASQDEAVAIFERWGLQTRERAQKAVQFLVDPTWRAYIFCYIEGLSRCRAFVGGDPARFERLLSEQFIPSDLVAA